jgi:hypothetical protein
VAYGIAQAMMDGFNRHYDLFRYRVCQSQAPLSKPKTGMANNVRSVNALSFMTCG